MDEETKLILALYQVEGITKLTENNEYKQYIFNHLNPIYYELQRQLSNLQHGQKTGRNGHGRVGDVPRGSREESI